VKMCTWLRTFTPAEEIPSPLQNMMAFVMRLSGPYILVPTGSARAHTHSTIVSNTKNEGT